MTEFEMRTVLKKIGLIFFGFAIALILLEVGLRIAGYLTILSQNRAARTGIDFGDENQYRILCIGESTTAQIFVNGKGEAWPAQMERILNATEKGPRRYKTVNKGVPGTVTAFILANLKDQLERYRPQLVVSMMGINDRASVLTYDEKPMSRLAMFFGSFRVVKFFRIFTNAARHGFRSEERPPSAPVLYINEPELVNALGKAVRASDAKESRRIVDEMVKKHPDKEFSAYAVYSGSILAAIRGGVFMNEEFIQEAFRVFKHVIELDKPAGDQTGKAYAAMSFLYARRNDWKNFFPACKMAIEYIDNKADKAYYITNYITFSRNQNRKDPYIAELIKRYKMSFSAKGRYAATRSHYRKLYEILEERKIKYAAMQYPTRDVRLLEYFFSDDHVPAIDDGDDYFFSTKPDAKYDNILKNDPNIIFISNEEPFNKALASRPYEYYFIDHFGGSFGHTTVEGHKLIGQDAADALRKSGILYR